MTWSRDRGTCNDSHNKAHPLYHQMYTLCMHVTGLGIKRQTVEFIIMATGSEILQLKTTKKKMCK